MNKDLIKQVIIENHEFINKVELIEREFFVENEGNYVFVGSRRAGKTYCMFQIIKNIIKTGTPIERILYINFEDERLLELKLEDLNLIIDCFREMFNTIPIIFLDEIQIINGWEKFGRRLADTGYRIFITGSNATMLSKEIATTLGGRFLIKEIFPFTFTEYLRANNVELEYNWEFSSQRFEIRKQFDTYFYFGGFPEILKFKEKRMWLDNLYQKIFYGDLIARYKIRNDFALKLLIKKMAESLHDEVSFNRIKNIIQSTGTKIGTATVVEYTSYLEESWLVFGIKNYLAKISERETSKKYYFIDNGILSLFLQKPETILLENIVACKLKQLYDNQLYYIRTQVEVDFYIPMTKTLIQVSYNIDNFETENREIESLLKVNETIAAENLIIITLDNDKVVTRNLVEVKVIPVWKWLLKN
jgi:predicted AAA+ superfamily ATPase